MTSVRGRMIGAVMCAALAGTASTQAVRQVSPAIMEAVIAYHTYWMGDSAPFDGCSVGRWTTGPSVRSAGRLIGGAPGETCTPGRLAPGAIGAAHLVYVDTALVTDSLTQVRLNVRHGEYTHQELFSLVRRAADGEWIIRDVRVWGQIQSYPAPVQPPVRGAGHAQGRKCGAESDQERRVATSVAQSREGATGLRLLRGSRDAQLCLRMYEYMQARARPGGATLERSRIAYYDAGSFYIAVIAREWPDRRSTPPGYVRIQTGLILVYVFDRTLTRGETMLQ